MAIHIRNLLSPYYGTNYTFYRWAMWLFREAIIEVGGWTETFKTTDAAWTSSSNLLLTVTDAAVDVNYPGRITSATGGFTGLSGYVTLKGANDKNKGIFSIYWVEDDNTLWVSEDTKSINGWVTESGITARIHNMGTGSLLATTEVRFVASPPTGNNQALFVKENGGSLNACDVRAYPKGDYLTSATLTATENLDLTFNAYRARFNFYMNGSTFLCWYKDNQNYFVTINFGELVPLSASDTYPGFCAAGVSNTIVNAYQVLDPIYSAVSAGYGAGSVNMLDHLDAQITAYPMILKGAANVSTTQYFYDGYTMTVDYPERLKLQAGKTKAQETWVCMSDSANGGYVRGKLPYRYGFSGLPKFTGISASWMHLDGGYLFPRDGLNDNRTLSA